MEQIHGSINMSELSLFLRILVCGIRDNGLLSIFIFCLQSLHNWVSKNCKDFWTKQISFSYNEPKKQRLNCMQHGVKLRKEEVIEVMEKLGVELDGDAIEDLGEQEITNMFENEANIEEVEEAFNVFDENKDGFIDAAELRRVLCCLGMKKDIVQCKKMINAVDQNGDELIDHNEFAMLMEQSFG
ncbi:hypothetical protein RJT34_02658 [Clitoria ternatea]|uniref:EF-hand domain-containing protein n=1 Tax=Clitoria ternatea TaxID=43366 RepID=A0AAN9KHG5_CLITE